MRRATSIVVLAFLVALCMPFGASAQTPTPPPTATPTSTPTPECIMVSVPTDTGTYVLTDGGGSYGRIIVTDLLFGSRINEFTTIESSIKLFVNASGFSGSPLEPNTVAVLYSFPGHSNVDAFNYVTTFTVEFCNLTPEPTPTDLPTNTPSSTPDEGTSTPTSSTPSPTAPAACDGMRVVPLEAVDHSTYIAISAGEWVFVYGGTADWIVTVTPFEFEVVPLWSDFPDGLYFPSAGSWNFVARSNTIAPEPTLLRICSSTGVATLTPVATDTPEPSNTPTNTNTPEPSLTPSNTPEPSLTPSNTPTVSLDNQDCAIGPVDGKDCEIINNQATQIALQKTQIALGLTPYPMSTIVIVWPTAPTAIVRPTDTSDDMTDAVATVCALEPCNSIIDTYEGVAGLLDTLQSNANAPDDCSTVYIPSGTGFITTNDMNKGFCLFITSTEDIRVMVKHGSVVLIVLVAAAYIINLARRLGDG